MNFKSSFVMRTAACLSAAVLAAGLVIVPGSKVFADGVLISEAFPDEAFREYVISEFNPDGDEYLSAAELANVKEIFADDLHIKSLKGIEYFDNLELLLCRDNEITSLDVSHNTKLKRLECYYNKIQELDLTNNPDLECVHCNDECLKVVDITGCTKLIKCISKGYTGMVTTASDHYMMFEHDIDSQEIDFMMNVGTRVIPFGYFYDCIDSFDLAYLLIRTCDIDHNYWFSAQELAAVTTLDVEGMNIYRMFVQEWMPNLEEFDCSDNDIRRMNLSENPKLKSLICNDNNLVQLDVSHNPDLTKLVCYGNEIKILDLSDHKDLVYVDAASEYLKGIDITGSPCIEKAYKEGVKTSYSNDEYGNITMYTYDVDGKVYRLIINDDTEVGIAINEKNFPDEAFRDYVRAELDPNRSGILTPEEIAGITNIACSNEEIKDLKGIEFFTELTRLECIGNSLTSIDVSKNVKLKQLLCGKNDLTSIDVSKNTELSTLNCSRNTNLASLDVSNNTKLKTLDCSNTKISELDVTANAKLIDLTVTFSQIKQLDLYNCPNLLTAYKEGEVSEGVTHGIAWIEYDYDDETYFLGMNKDVVVVTVKPTATPTPTATQAPASAATGASNGTSAGTATASGNGTGGVNDVSLTINKETTAFACGKTETLRATLRESTDTIVWKSSNTKVATVDANGKVKGKMAGTVTITASAAGKSVSCKVTVLYKDVTDPAKFWYAPTNYLTAEGVVKGYDKQTKFKPANNCTRAQMVTFIWRLAGEPSPKTSKCKFSDVKKTDYFYKACIWGNENHIVEGYKNGTFGPQIVCARRHAVTFLWRLAGKPEPSTKKNKFSDVKKSNYFYKATLWASEKKILEGYDDGTFRPDGDCLRRQMVTFLYKYDKFVNGKG